MSKEASTIRTVHFAFTDLVTMCGIQTSIDPPYTPNIVRKIKYDEVTCLQCFELLLMQGVDKEKFVELMKLQTSNKETSNDKPSTSATAFPNKTDYVTNRKEGSQLPHFHYGEISSECPACLQISNTEEASTKRHCDECGQWIENGHLKSCLNLQISNIERKCKNCNIELPRDPTREMCQRCDPFGVFRISNTKSNFKLYCGYCDSALEYVSEEGAFQCGNFECKEFTLVRVSDE